MTPSTLGSTWNRLFHRTRRPQPARAAGTGRRPQLELLEDRVVPAGTGWTALTNAAPDTTGIGTMMLLSDGTVLAQGGGSAGATNVWWKLTPAANGSYGKGTWSQAATMNVQRLYFGSNVMPDGRVFVVGGEYSSAGSFTNTGEIYDPVANTWTPITKFVQSQYGDDPTQVLQNGQILAGYISGPQTYFYNPSTNSWSAAATKLNNDQSDEEGWVKLANGTILSYDVFHSVNSGISTAQYYDPSANKWNATGNVPVLLSSSADGYELGPATLLQDGRALFLGANGNSAIYTPSTNSWVAGPTIPNGQGADDAPGAELANGQFIFAADNPLFHSPTHLYVFNPSTNAITQMTLPTGLSSALSRKPSYVDRMLVLPTGQVLFTDGTDKLWIYTPSTGASASVKPVINSVVNNNDGTYTLTGTQLNGQSEGAAYGDDAEMASNYPIVYLKSSTGNVYYARTSGWDNNWVQTGSTVEHVNFTLPAGLPAGTYSLFESGAGINSAAFTFTTPGAQAALATAVPGQTSGSTAVTPSAAHAGQSAADAVLGAILGSSSSSSAVRTGSEDGVGAIVHARDLANRGSGFEAVDAVFAGNPFGGTL